ncbi:unnamed protein product [Peronospora farinosa]|uniref:Uncharacterized protein n=1 Tax=Peronospora farinosa TaxID=134698 RepID=A0ABN8BZ10_9STRA|nr:unnamed protein product [Peronospora farinosa]
MSPLSSRTTSTAQEDEYFPSFLTALQSTPKADKSKESTPHSRSETSLLFSNGKPRLTFAESLSMNRNKQQSVEMPEDSPFNFGGSYQDKLGTRRRKNASSQGATNSNNTQDEDILPPPTMSLLDPVGFAAGSHNVDDDEAAAMAAAARRSAAVQPSYYPNVHAERVGSGQTVLGHGVWLPVECQIFYPTPVPGRGGGRELLQQHRWQLAAPALPHKTAGREGTGL